MRGVGYTDKIIKLFADHPGWKYTPRQLAEVGGFAGWRTRVSNARIQFKREGIGTIRNEVEQGPHGAKLSVYWLELWTEQGECHV